MAQQIISEAAINHADPLTVIKAHFAELAKVTSRWLYQPQALSVLSGERVRGQGFDVEGPQALPDADRISIDASSNGGGFFDPIDPRNIVIGSAGWLGTTGEGASATQPRNFTSSRSDEIFGGNNDDILISFSRVDGGILHGNDGDDVVIGSDRGDTLYGGEDDDALLGLLGVDYLYGEDGEDRLDGGDGADHVFGGADFDRLVARFDGAVDEYDGQGGNDTIVYKYDTGDGLIRVLAPQSEAQVPADFGLSIATHVGGASIGSTGTDTLISIEKAAVEAGSGSDVLRIVKDGVGVDISKLEYVDLGGQAAGQFDAVVADDWDDNIFISLNSNRAYWLTPGDIWNLWQDRKHEISVRDGEIAIGGNGDDSLVGGNDAAKTYVLDGNSGNNFFGTIAGTNFILGGDGDDAIQTDGGTNYIVGGAGLNRIRGRGTVDYITLGATASAATMAAFSAGAATAAAFSGTVASIVATGATTALTGAAAQYSENLIELGVLTRVEGADKDDALTKHGVKLLGGIQQWWNESGIAVWSPNLAIKSAFPFVGAQAIVSAFGLKQDLQYMKFVKYKVDATTGDALISFNAGLGGSAVIKDWDIDLSTGRGDAGLTIFRQGKVKQGTNSAIKASNGFEQYMNLALYSARGFGLPGFDPLVFDLDDNGYDLIDREYSQAYFEFDNDGFAENAGWIGGNDALLARDLNANGSIDNITELFGNRTTSGFSALAALDSNNDGVINASDAAFGTLRLWKDANSNAVTDAGELVTLANAGITSISLASVTLDPANAANTVRGNQIVREGSFTRTDGTTGKVGDVALVVSDTDTRWTGSGSISVAAQALPQIAGIGELKNLRLAMTGDATLLSQVNSFKNNTGASVATLRGQVEGIIYRWAGVDGVAATAIGANGFNRRKLAFLEKYTGIQLMPRDGNGAPQVIVAANDSDAAEWVEDGLCGSRAAYAQKILK